MADLPTSDKARRVLDRLRASGDRLVTAESCTGGLIAATLTDIAGSSDCIEGGFVTYSNALKNTALAVSHLSLETNGAISEVVAVEMAFGALQATADATIAVSVTGIAGPEGGTPDKPVGTVCIGLVRGTHTPYHEINRFEGDRAAIRKASCDRVFDLLLDPPQTASP
ncbi:CinA family protein [Swaminathania salitolerans]|uniref:CinA C-terminal domain-containing protein n=1 Tax=Swaminathania salitolerans TaxID=182838 RepID=A0A511BMX2_9PROT|nr:CinA family protein [Swaminathania salitolerans]GBQ13932.1 hypothetical protein AA21291_1667 [Swaminathania salitolerans LMG 21291]GEL01690.1 hypothetical protein SSA02_08530 [Swaminathania salitolerans]